MKKMKKGDIILIGVILLIALGLSLFYFFAAKDAVAEEVVIEVNGEIVKTFSLPQKQLVEYQVKIDEDDYNLIQILGEKVRVVEATCPEQIDVKQGWIARPGQSLVCLPHKLIVKIEGSTSENDVDLISY